MPQYNIKQVKGATQGSVLFLGPNGVVSENNSKLFWNITSSRLEIGGDLIVSGSFSVLGSASNIFTTNLVVSDPIILLAGSQSGAPALDSGFFINRGTGATQAFIWDESDGKFAVVQTNNSSTAIGNVNINTGAQIRALRYNFFDSGSPAAAASATINAPSGGSIALNAVASVQFITPQLASSNQVTSWDIGSNTLEFGGSNTRSFKLGIADGGSGIPTFMFYSTSAGSSGTSRTGMSFSHVIGSQLNNVLERGYVIEVRDSGTFSGTAVGLVIDVTGVTNSNRAKRGLRIVDGSQANGYLLVSDTNGYATWTASTNIFNGPTGSGTVNYLPRWSTSTQLSSTSSIYDTGDTVLISNSATSSFLGIGPNGTNAKVVVSYQASANSTTTLFVDGPSSNTVTGGGHAAYFRRNIDNAGATSSVVTIEHTNRSGVSPGASTLRIMSGYNGKLSQFQALSGGVFQIGNTYSDSVNRSLLTLNMDTNTLPDPTNNDRYSLRVIDNLPNLGSAATRYGVSVVMGASFSPQNPSVQKLYGIYSDVSGVGSTSSTASVYAGAFVGGNVAIAGVGGTAFAGALLHVSGANYNIPLIIASGSSSDDLVRITQVGTGNAFVVEDSSNPDSTGFVIDTNGNVGIGTASSASYKMNILGSSSFTGYTRKMQSGTYSFINLGANTALDAQYLTNSSTNQAFNIGSVGLAAPQGLTTSSRAYFIGLAGVSYWNRDTNFGPTQPTGIGGNAATLIGTLGEVAIVAPTSGGTAFGGAGLASVLINQTAGTTVSNMFGVRVSWSGTNLGYTNNYYGFYMVDDFSNGNATNIGNRYGIYIDDVQAQNIFQGTVSIGNTTKTYKLNITGSASMDGFRLTTGAVNNYILTSDTNGVGTWTSPATVVSSGGGVTGSGTTNYGARWITSTQLGTGSIYDSGTGVGIATQSSGAFALNVYGDVNIAGTLYATSKSFDIVHPLDPTKRLTYGSLEGPEYGVYVRGKLDGNSVIDLPDYWVELVDETTITVNITPFGGYQRLFVDKIENNKVYIGNEGSLTSPRCHYIVYAERKDIPKIIVEQ